MVATDHRLSNQIKELTWLLTGSCVHHGRVGLGRQSFFSSGIVPKTKLLAVVVSWWECLSGQVTWVAVVM